jgi:FMN phosphatase YigB (HAD superfamily)
MMPDLFMIDIDSTITEYRPDALAPEKLLHGNFLFPIIRDLMVENGATPERAAQQILQLTYDVVCWDYPDFIAEFRLPIKEAFQRFHRWHRENMLVYESTLEILRNLHRRGKKLVVMSNNPYCGCCMKLQRAGLPPEFFARILGTNIVRGCKGDPEVWYRAAALLCAAPEEIAIIGDNEHEDGDLPLSLGFAMGFLLTHGTPKPIANNPKISFISSPQEFERHLNQEICHETLS